MPSESTIWSGPADRVPAGRNPVVGDVAAFDDARGLGVIEFGTGHRIGFHCTAITDGSRHIDVGAVVAFEVSAGRLGRLEAHSVRPLPGVPHPGATLADEGFAEPGLPPTHEWADADPVATTGEMSAGEVQAGGPRYEELPDEENGDGEPSAYEDPDRDLPLELPGREALRLELERHARLAAPAAAAAAPPAVDTVERGEGNPSTGSLGGPPATTADLGLEPEEPVQPVQPASGWEPVPPAPAWEPVQPDRSWEPSVPGAADAPVTTEPTRPVAGWEVTGPGDTVSASAWPLGGSRAIPGTGPAPSDIAAGSEGPVPGYGGSASPTGPASPSESGAGEGGFVGPEASSERSEPSELSEPPESTGPPEPVVATEAPASGRPEESGVGERGDVTPPMGTAAASAGMAGPPPAPSPPSPPSPASTPVGAPHPNFWSPIARPSSGPPPTWRTPVTPRTPPPSEGG